MYNTETKTPQQIIIFANYMVFTYTYMYCKYIFIVNVIEHFNYIY